MTAEWDRVKRVFQAALDTLPEKRAAFVCETCGTDHGLRTEVESLLLAHEHAGSFAQQPALEAWPGGSSERVLSASINRGRSMRCPAMASAS